MIQKLFKEPVVSWQQVQGGCSHHIYQVKTAKGLFAVKRLNPDVVSFLGSLEQYQQREKIAEELAKQGLPAIFSIAQKQYQFIYPWVEGELVALKQINAVHINMVAETLAAIHQAKIDINGLPFSAWQMLPVTDWVLLMERVKEHNQAWARLFIREIDSIQRWTEQYMQASQHLLGTAVLSHGDLNHLNILWRDEQLFILDWEGLGRAYPKAELFNMALCWSGFVSGHGDKHLFNEFIDVYQAANPVGKINEDDRHAALGYWLIWLKFSVLRCLGELVCEPDQHAFFQSAVQKTIALLKLFEQGKFAKLLPK